VTDGPRLSPTLVQDAAGVAALADALGRERVVALDTESNSFHVYRERVCLIQVSTASGDWLVDPLAADPRPLGPALAAAPVVVLHGADYDVRCLKREWAFTLPGLFDTMAAARRLGWREIGLSALVERQFGVRLSKAFQRSDWGRRPLSPEQVRYAALDTHYLARLHEQLARDLAARGLDEEARREFARIAAVEPRPKVFDREAWRKLKGARDLDAEGRAVLARLWVAREERASAADRPPFKIMSPETMVELARRRPRGVDAMLAVPGVTPTVLRRMADAIGEAVEAAASPPRGAGDPG
jgi:ribonuclease D